MKREHGTYPEPGSVTPAGPLETAIAGRARDGRIACGELFRLAAAAGVPVAEAGRAVQRLGIKVTTCQLGCFP